MSDKLQKFLEYQNEDRKYKVILLTPDGYAGMENAQIMLQEALEILLNSHTLGPGFRFSEKVTAALETAHDIDEVVRRSKREKDMALVIACGFEEKQLKPLAKICTKNAIDFCYARDIPLDEKLTTEQQAQALGDEDPHTIPVRIGKPKKFKHVIDSLSLTEPVPSSPEVLEDRRNNLILLLAIGVMQSHHAHGPSV